MGIFSSSTADGRGKPVPLGQCCRPALAQTVQAQYKQLGGWLTASQVPIVYSPVYNIGFLGVSGAASILAFCNASLLLSHRLDKSVF